MKKLYFLLTTVIILVLAQLPAMAQDWNLQTIDNDVTNYQQVKIDNNGIPHVLANDWYYKWNGITWDKKSVPYSSGYNTFCLDDDGVAHVANTYDGGTYDYIFHEYLENNSWKIDTVYSYNNTIRPIAIFYGANSNINKPDVLLCNYYSNTWRVYYSKYDNTSQKYFLRAYIFSVSVNANLGYPYADYCTDTEGNLYYVYTGLNDEIVFNFYDGTNWSSLYVTDGTNDCQYPRITLDQNDIPHISYYDVVTKDLIHAKLPAQTLKMLKEGKLKTHVPSQNFEAIAE